MQIKIIWIKKKTKDKQAENTKLHHNPRTFVFPPSYIYNEDILPVAALPSAFSLASRAASLLCTTNVHKRRGRGELCRGTEGTGVRTRMRAGHTLMDTCRQMEIGEM